MIKLSKCKLLYDTFIIIHYFIWATIINCKYSKGKPQHFKDNPFFRANNTKESNKGS